MRKRKVLRVVLLLHKESDLGEIVDTLSATLMDLKHQKGEINGFEIRESFRMQSRTMT